MENVLKGQFDQRLSYFKENFSIEKLNCFSETEIIGHFFDDISEEKTLISFLQKDDIITRIKDNAINFGITKIELESYIFQKVDDKGEYIEDRDDYLLKGDSRRILETINELNMALKGIFTSGTIPDNNFRLKWNSTKPAIREYFSYLYPTRITSNKLSNQLLDFSSTLLEYSIKDNALENIHMFNKICRLETCNLFDFHYEYIFLPRNRDLIIDVSTDIKTNKSFLLDLMKGSAVFSNAQVNMNNYFIENRNFKSIEILINCIMVNRKVYLCNLGNVFKEVKLLDIMYGKKETTILIGNIKDISFELDKTDNPFILFKQCSLSGEFEFLDQIHKNYSSVISRLASGDYVKELKIDRDVCSSSSSHQLKNVNAKLLYYYQGIVEEIEILALYCEMCNEYQISKANLDNQLGIYNIQHIVVDFKDNDDYFYINNFQEQSLIYSLGYTVNKSDNVPSNIRRAILDTVLRSGIWDYDRLDNHIRRQINLRKNNTRNENAVNEWESDLRFIRLQELSYRDKAQHMLFYKFDK